MDWKVLRIEEPISQKPEFRTDDRVRVKTNKLFLCPVCRLVYSIFEHYTCGERRFKADYYPGFPTYGLPRTKCPDCEKEKA